MDIIRIIDNYGKTKKDSIAHISRDSTITYGELYKKSNALSAFLIDKYGVDKTPIIVYGHKQNEMLCAFLACVKSGHAYIPVDSSLPKERIKSIIESSKSKLILAIKPIDIEFDTACEILNIDEINSIFKNLDYREPSMDYYVKDEDVYYIIYTSGSTGKPKGVQITKDCLHSFIKWSNNLIDEDKSIVFMNQAPFSFDLSVMDLYLSLYNGGILFSIDKDMTANIKELFQYLCKSNINVWVSTPSFAEMCLADSSFNDSLLKEIHTFLFCGETLTNSCAQRLQERFKNACIYNTYGPTEATVAITSVEINEDIVKNISPLPVGYVKEDCKVLIMSGDNKELKDGEKGEIVIVGDSVSIGYYNNEEMTKKAFLKYSLGDALKRAYRTGDEGYIKDGMLYYCGRMDFQIKLNGYRIELEDIENNLRKLDYIKNSVTIPYVKDGKPQYLCAFIVLNEISDEKEFKVALKIKNDLKEFLPEYMIPRKIIFKESLPMTSNGKVNRKLLIEELK